MCVQTRDLMSLCPIQEDYEMYNSSLTKRIPPWRNWLGLIPVSINLSVGTGYETAWGNIKTGTFTVHFFFAAIRLVIQCCKSISPYPQYSVLYALIGKRKLSPWLSQRGLLQKKRLKWGSNLCSSSSTWTQARYTIPGLALKNKFSLVCTWPLLLTDLTRLQ